MSFCFFDISFGASARLRTAAEAGFLSLPIFFATNREVLDATKQGQGKGAVKKFFGTSRSEKISYGLSWVSVPDGLNYGDTDGSIWRYSANRRGAPRNKIVHLTTVPLLVGG